jgi:hypothetical protein
MFPLLIKPVARLFTCRSTFFCADLGDAFECQPLRPLGDPCEFHYQCAGDSYCGSLGGESECSPRLSEGSPGCTGPAQCETLFCNSGGRCADPTEDEVWCPDPFGILTP